MAGGVKTSLHYVTKLLQTAKIQKQKNPGNFTKQTNYMAVKSKNIGPEPTPSYQM